MGGLDRQGAGGQREWWSRRASSGPDGGDGGPDVGHRGDDQLGHRVEDESVFLVAMPLSPMNLVAKEDRHIVSSICEGHAPEAH